MNDDRQDRSIWTVIDQVRKEASDVAIRTSNHEVLCAERYKEINVKLKFVLWAVGILVVSQLFGLDKAAKVALHMMGISP